MVTFQQMIILCSEDGTLDMTPQAIHFRTGIPLEIIKEGIEILEQEDTESRSPDKNGKRIERIDEHRTWGWRLVNHKYYKNLVSWEEKKEKDRIRIREMRSAEKLNKNKDVASCRNESQPVLDVAHTDTDTYTNTDTDKNKRKYNVVSFPLKGGKEYQADDEYLAELDSLYPDLEIQAEFRKIRAWCLSQEENRRKVRPKQFINNWMLNAQDRINEKKPPQPKTLTDADIEALNE